MTTYHKPTLETERHHYPFLLAYAFDSRDADKLRLEVLRSMVNEYFVRHIQRIATKKGSSSEAALELIIKEIQAGHVNNGGYGDLGVFATELMSKRQITIKSSFDGMAALDLKRFGECLGVRLVDSSDHKHELATDIFEGMTPSRADGGFDYLGQFVHAYRITMPRWKAYGNGWIDVAEEFISAARYVPDVEWHTDVVSIAEKLFDHYIQNSGMFCSDSGGVEVGRYHGIPIRMQVLFGDKKSDQVWRRGAISRDGAVLSFDSQSSESPYVRYVIRTADDNNFFKDAAPGIDYLEERSCLGDLSEILFNAFSARYLAESIASDPRRVAWQLKEPQAEAVA